MSSLPVPGPQYKNAEWIWNDEANELLEKASAEHTNYNDNPVQYVTAIHISILHLAPPHCPGTALL